MTRISLRTNAAVLFSFFILAGCDALRGVNRRALVRYAPASDCVIRSLQSIQGISNVRYEAHTGGRSLTWTGLKPPDKLHYYFYDFQALSGNLYFLEDYKGKVEFVQLHKAQQSAPTSRDRYDSAGHATTGETVGN